MPSSNSPLLCLFSLVSTSCCIGILQSLDSFSAIAQEVETLQLQSIAPPPTRHQLGRSPLTPPLTSLTSSSGDKTNAKWTKENPSVSSTFRLKETVNMREPILELESDGLVMDADRSTATNSTVDASISTLAPFQGGFHGHRDALQYAQTSPPEPSSSPTTDLEPDPELGILRLIELPVDSFDLLDPELGILRLQELPVVVEESYPSIFLRAYTNFFWTDNVLSVVDDPIDDGIFQVGLSLSAFPALGTRTYLMSSVTGDLVRYTDQAPLDYNDIDLNLGVYHAVTRRGYLELGWNNEQFFDRKTGDRFLNDHSFYVSLGRRDRLTPRLRLNTFYEFEYNLSDPVERSRAINELNTILTYQITPKLEADLFYQLTLVDFTRQNRNDFYQQVITGLNYDLSSNSQISLFGGWRFGDSSENFLDFNSALVGVSISVNLPLF